MLLWYEVESEDKMKIKVELYKYNNSEIDVSDNSSDDEIQEKVNEYVLNHHSWTVLESEVKTNGRNKHK